MKTKTKLNLNIEMLNKQTRKQSVTLTRAAHTKSKSINQSVLLFSEVFFRIKIKTSIRFIRLKNRLLRTFCGLPENQWTNKHQQLLEIHKFQYIDESSEVYLSIYGL